MTLNYFRIGNRKGRWDEAEAVVKRVAWIQQLYS